MQTLLPYKSFESSAKVLFKEDLGRVRVDALQIMRALAHSIPSVHSGVSEVPWLNHEATQMWQGYEWALMSYQTVMCQEWVRRGFVDSLLEKTQLLFQHFPEVVRHEPIVPNWLGFKRLHASHRAFLLHERPKYYARFGWPELPEEGFWWPQNTSSRSDRTSTRSSL